MKRSLWVFYDTTLVALTMGICTNIICFKEGEQKTGFLWKTKQNVLTLIQNNNKMVYSNVELEVNKMS